MQNWMAWENMGFLKWRKSLSTRIRSGECAHGRTGRKPLLFHKEKVGKDIPEFMMIRD